MPLSVTSSPKKKRARSPAVMVTVPGITDTVTESESEGSFGSVTVTVNGCATVEKSVVYLTLAVPDSGMTTLHAVPSKPALPFIPPGRIPCWSGTTIGYMPGSVSPVSLIESRYSRYPSPVRVRVMFSPRTTASASDSIVGGTASPPPRAAKTLTSP